MTLIGWDGGGTELPDNRASNVPNLLPQVCWKLWSSWATTVCLFVAHNPGGSPSGTSSGYKLLVLRMRTRSKEARRSLCKGFPSLFPARDPLSGMGLKLHPCAPAEQDLAAFPSQHRGMMTHCAALFWRFLGDLCLPVCRTLEPACDPRPEQHRRGGRRPVHPEDLRPHQLNYLGPPFNEPDFNPPRMTRAEMVPSATVDFELWRSLNDNARLAANYRAYTHLLCYLRSMDGQVAKAELRKNLGHFCTSLQGLVVSIASVMSSLGYPLPSPLGSANPTWAQGPGATSPHNDFLKKMDDFWLLKELQTWLWRSAKDFNRLKKKVPPAALMLRLEMRGF
ncbi:cardiotrophin-like cytokine factor 1 isoform X2 [Mauremys reevesii]|uniref:cardiotrophin-like cytokine factor 1 isoform X2 n=1 Tax=Mauremys reevesii TaxID=260615 RepID=UPI00193F8F14|nr:cardiotrophin-like cytokine factor 1 isoform X2 [Mauremys reevesii]